MTCPDANILAQMHDGRLDDDELGRLHEHIDGCRRCSELLMVLGGQFSSDALTSENGKHQRLGRYELRRVIGAGGMGVVYEAFDPELSRRVAIKLLHPQRLDSTRQDDHLSRLRREARLLAQLSHPNIVTIYDVGSHEGQPFLAIQFVDGATLTRWAESNHAGWQRITELLVEAGRGIAAAHDAGIIHRDIKPDNILVSHDEEVYVTDFGLASQFRPPDALSSVSGEGQPRDEAHQLTQTGAGLGTPAYMSPEQFRGESADERSDCFSFCATLYRVVYGRPPFEGENIYVIANHILEGNVADPPKTEAPDELFELIGSGLHRCPDRRPQSMHDVVASLERILDTRRRPSPGFIKWIVATTGAAVLAVATLVVVTQNDNDQLSRVEDETAKMAAIDGPTPDENADTLADAGDVSSDVDSSDREQYRPNTSDSGSDPVDDETTDRRPLDAPEHRADARDIEGREDSSTGQEGDDRRNMCESMGSCVPDAGTITWRVDGRETSYSYDALATYFATTDAMELSLPWYRGPGLRIYVDQVSTRSPFSLSCEHPPNSQTSMTLGTTSSPWNRDIELPPNWGNQTFGFTDCAHAGPGDDVLDWRLEIDHISTESVQGSAHATIKSGDLREGDSLEFSATFDASLHDQ